MSSSKKEKLRITSLFELMLPLVRVKLGCKVVEFPKKVRAEKLTVSTLIVSENVKDTRSKSRSTEKLSN